MREARNRKEPARTGGHSRPERRRGAALSAGVRTNLEVGGETGRDVTAFVLSGLN
jgi:hypothetical protein